MAMSATMLLATALLGAPTSALEFQVPSGWVDLSPGVLELNAAGVDPEEVEAVRGLFARDSSYTMYAVKVDEEGRVLAAVSGLMTECPVADSGWRAVERIRVLLYRQSCSGSRFRVSAREHMEIWRVEADIEQKCRSCEVPKMLGVAAPARWDHHTRQRQHWISQGERCGVLTYSGAPSRFDQFLPEFEAAAHATRGPYGPWWLRGPDLALGIGLAATFIGILANAHVGQYRRRKSLNAKA